MEDRLICEGINSKGYGIIPKLIMQDRTIHATAKCIYAYFCSFAGAGSLCFPTRSKICYDLCISIDTYGKYLRQLIEHGYIKCEQIKENGRFSHNVYTLCSTISPCPKISDTEDIVYDNLDTNNNNIKNNNNYKNNNFKERNAKERKTIIPPYGNLSYEIVEEKINNLNESEKVKDLIRQIMFVNRTNNNKPITSAVFSLFMQRLAQVSDGNEEIKIKKLEDAVLGGFNMIYLDANDIKNKSTYTKKQKETNSDKEWNKFMEEIQSEEINVDVISEKTSYEELPF